LGGPQPNGHSCRGDGKRSIVRLCGKRLQALLPLRLESLERHGHQALNPEVREKLLSISCSTIDQLTPTRERSARAMVSAGQQGHSAMFSALKIQSEISKEVFLRVHGVDQKVVF
jgi:hypothetical protein